MKELKIDIYAPITRMSYGPMTLDPVATALGMPLPEKMAPLLRALHSETERNGAPAYYLPCKVKDGKDLSLTLGPLGRLAIGNDGGLLALTLPEVLASQLGPGVEGMIEDSQDLNPGKRLWFKLTPGASMSIPLASFGTLEFVVPN